MKYPRFYFKLPSPMNGDKEIIVQSYLFSKYDFTSRLCLLNLEYLGPAAEGYFE